MLIRDRDSELFVGAQSWARTNSMPDIEQQTNDPQLPPERPGWRARIRRVLRSLGGVAHLQEIYRAVEADYDGTRERKHWKAKVRQEVQKDPEIERVGDGVWGLVSRSSTVFKKQ
jgi:hypothetical protein